MEKSESIKNFALAMVKFHSLVGKIKKDSNNPFFKSKYADLSDIQDAIQGPLNESGLVISQLPMGKNELTTILIHAESGEFIMGTYEMTPVKSDPQSIGSCITYQKRYALSAILNLNLDKDDDGNEASKSSATTIPTAKEEPKEQPKSLPEITVKMFDQLIARLKVGENDVITKAKDRYSFSKEKGDLVNKIMKAKKADGIWDGAVVAIADPEFKSLIKIFRESGDVVLLNGRKFFSFSAENEQYISKVIESLAKKQAA